MRSLKIIIGGEITVERKVIGESTKRIKRITRTLKNIKNEHKKRAYQMLLFVQNVWQNSPIRIHSMTNILTTN